MNLEAIVFGLSIGLLISFVAFGFALTFSVMKFINFAHSDLLTIGAYCTFVCTKIIGLNLILGAIIGIAITGLLGVLMERLVFRPLSSQRLSMFVSSLGISLVLNATMTLCFGSSSRTLSGYVGTIKAGPIRLTYPELFAFIVFGVIFVLVSIGLRRTQYGLALRAIAENRDGVAVLGIPCNRLASATFFISASLAALAGVLLGLMHDVTPQMGQRYGIWSFAIVVVSGLGNISGIPITGLIAGIIIALVMFIFGSYTYVNVALFGIMSLILLTRPEGLFSIRLRHL
jgi:branched-subunit amino acid ABC-type transport system permease component